MNNVVKFPKGAAAPAATTAEALVVTLTKIEYSKRLSEETDAFAAVVCLNGVPAFEATNDGHGGCNHYQPLRGQTGEAFRANMDRFEKWVAETTKCETANGMLSLEMDSVIGDIFGEWLNAKEYDRLAKTHVVMVEDGKCYTLKLKGLKPAQLTQDQRDHIAKKHMPAQILNWLPREQAVALYLATIPKA